MNPKVDLILKQAEQQQAGRIFQIEKNIRQQVETKRCELEVKVGLSHDRALHFVRPKENPFTRNQRDHTTILFGGFTWRHEHLIEGAWCGLGYKCQALPTPDQHAFRLGKEYGNNGQCNPAYFTVGNLVKHLQSLEAKGMNRQEIVNNYVFLTAGSCGPCRFGMYEAEYRLALRNAGFDGFRVLLLQQAKGLNQSNEEAGVDMNLDFTLALIKAMNIGDMLNELGFQIRPYEIEPGKTDRVMEEALAYLHKVLRDKPRVQLTGIWKRFFASVKLESKVNYLVKFLDLLASPYYVRALNRVRGKFDGIAVDRFRVKPLIKITGEFWAQTTEGDGNFNMFRFLEGEGAEVIVEPLGTWLLYLIHQYRQERRDRKGLEDGEETPPWWRLDRRLASNKRYMKRQGAMALVERIFKHEYTRLQKALSGTLHKLADQYELQRIAHPFYNSRTEGGEGHLEVAKNIYYHNRDLCHMVLSLKPFGCLPSTQSDGAQAAVVERYKDMIYLPIETSGEGEINAHSRVQMALGNARVKARQEFQDALAGAGRSLEDLKTYVDEHPALKCPTYHVPHRKGVVGKAANFVLHIADLMDGKARLAPCRN